MGRGVWRGVAMSGAMLMAALAEAQLPRIVESWGSGSGFRTGGRLSSNGRYVLGALTNTPGVVPNAIAVWKDGKISVLTDPVFPNGRAGGIGAISDDGTVAVGLLPNNQVFRWSAADGFQTIDRFFSAYLSADGRTIVAGNAPPVLWRPPALPEPLQNVAVAPSTPLCFGLSADGRTAIGRAFPLSGILAAKWVDGVVPQLIGLPDFSTALMTSADGSVVYGATINVTGYPGNWIWRTTSGGTSIPLFEFGALPLPVPPPTADGWVFIAGIQTAGGTQLWDPVHRLRSIEELGIAALVPGTSEVGLSQISADGTRATVSAIYRLPFFRTETFLIEMAPFCYANCDGSTTPPVLNALDFQCFLNKWRARDVYADCDPTDGYTAGDFLCFLNKLQQGCQ